MGTGGFVFFLWTDVRYVLSDRNLRPGDYREFSLADSDRDAGHISASAAGRTDQVLCSAADPRRITCIAVGVAALSVGSRMSGIDWTAGKGLLLAEAILCGGVMLLGLFMIEGIFCIHSVKSVELVNALTYGGRSACQYPVDTYPRPMRVLFTVVAPFALTLHLPGSVILGKPLFDWPEWAAYISPLSGGVVFGLIWLWFQKEMRYYRSTGS